MPMRGLTVEDQRLEFVRLAGVAGANVAALCRRFGISRRAGYKWIGRFRAAGEAGLADRPRRPKSSPGRMPPALERRAAELRLAHRGWGGRKIARVLGAELARAGAAGPGPSPAAVTRALHRAGLIDPAASEQRRPPVRFERDRPNDLWQIDFKGHVPMAGGGRCHPLAALDDCTRYNVLLAACADERDATVRGHLTAAFRRYGLPRQLLSDNGSPWGTSGWCLHEQWTGLTVWLMRLGVQVLHGRPRHPQTQGKQERFNRTLVDDLLRWDALADLADAGGKLAAFRETYNFLRPHEALGLACPGSRYTCSPRAYPERPAPVEYAAGELVRRVAANGRISVRGRSYAVGRAFAGEPVALRPTVRGPYWQVYYACHLAGWVDIDTGESGGPSRPLPDPLVPAAAGGETGGPAA